MNMMLLQLEMGVLAGGRISTLDGLHSVSIDLLQERRTALISAAVTGQIARCRFLVLKQ